MALTHVPDAGEVLMCDFDGFKKPEMVKVRRVVVLSPRARRGYPQTYIVVPLSKTAPDCIEKHHCAFGPRSYTFFHSSETVWAKADMVCCVARHRLDRLRFNGRYQSCDLRKDDLERIRGAVLSALGMQAWKKTADIAESFDIDRIIPPDPKHAMPGMPNGQ